MSRIGKSTHIHFDRVFFEIIPSFDEHSYSSQVVKRTFFKMGPIISPEQVTNNDSMFKTVLKRLNRKYNAR